MFKMFKFQGFPGFSMPIFSLFQYFYSRNSRIFQTFLTIVNYLIATTTKNCNFVFAESFRILTHPTTETQLKNKTIVLWQFLSSLPSVQSLSLSHFHELKIHCPLVTHLNMLEGHVLFCAKRKNISHFLI